MKQELLAPAGDIACAKAALAAGADAILRGYEYYSACHNNFSQLINLLTAVTGE